MVKTRIVIRGWAAVYRDDEQVSEPTVIRTLDGLVYDDEKFTDHIGGTDEENSLAEALESGGSLRFGCDDGESLLTVTTEYRSRRPLTDTELTWLVAYTLGQWSDGIGENWYYLSEERCGFTISCLTPTVQVIKE